MSTYGRLCHPRRASPGKESCVSIRSCLIAGGMSLGLMTSRSGGIGSAIGQGVHLSRSKSKILNHRGHRVSQRKSTEEAKPLWFCSVHLCAPVVKDFAFCSIPKQTETPPKICLLTVYPYVRVFYIVSSKTNRTEKCDWKSTRLNSSHLPL